MVKKRTKRYDDGGTVVVGNKPQGDWGGGGTGFTNMGGYTMPSGGGMALGRGSAGSGGGSSTPLSPPVTAPSSFTPISTTSTGAGNVYGPSFSLGRGSVGFGLGRGAIGGSGPVAGVGARFSLAKGGKAEAKAKAKPKPKLKPKNMAKGGKVSSASKRADGCATKGKTKGRFV